MNEASDFEDKMAQLRMLQMRKKAGIAPDQKVINKILKGPQIYSGPLNKIYEKY